MIVCIIYDDRRLARPMYIRYRPLFELLSRVNEKGGGSREGWKRDAKGADGKNETTSHTFLFDR